MITQPPDNIRFEELIAEVELQGGDGATELCRPTRITMAGRRLPPSDEGEAKFGQEGTAQRLAQAQVTETCSCGNPTQLTISYAREDDSTGMYKACAVCDAVAMQPRFT
jgi:hypothetical protein